MTFLNPAMLWGLLALAVPIIVHFFNLQRPKEVLFSNVAFVREVKKSVVRRLQFKQWLLLLARLLAISLLVLAFANPVIVDPDRQQLQGNRSVAIVLDNSFSMTAGNEKGNYFAQAQSLARQIIQAHGKQDEFLLMTSAQLQLNAGFLTSEEAVENIRQLQYSQQTRTHGEILGFAPRFFSLASNQAKELYFISDFQQSTVLADSQRVSLEDSSILIKYLPLASRTQQNVYIKDQVIDSRILSKGKPVVMKMTLVNDGSQPVNELGVRVNLEGKVVAIANQSLDPSATAELELTFTPENSGWLSGFIELDDYPIEFDNRRYFSLYVPDREKVLLVANEEVPEISLLYQDIFQAFDTKIISPRSIAGEDLSRFRSVVWVGLNSISSGLADRLGQFVKDGGSLMVFPGPKLEIEQINGLFSSLNVGSFAAAITSKEGKLVDQTDLNHPLFEGVFSENRSNRTFDAPVVYSYYPFTANNAAVQQTIMRLEDGNPFLQEIQTEKGRLFVFSTFPEAKWTDFQVKTSFAPVLFRLTQVMNQTQKVASGQELGAFVPKVVRVSSQELVRMKGPEDQEYIPEQYLQRGGLRLNFERLSLQPGNYQLVQSDSLLEKISFNISDAESKLAFIPPDALSQMLAQAGYGGIQVLPAEPDQLVSKIQTEKEGQPLWKYFLIGALLFLLVEVLLLKIKSA